MSLISQINRLGVCAAVWAIFSACAPSSYAVKAPATSGLKYEAVAVQSKTQLSILDERRGEDKTFSSGILPAALTLDKAPIDPPQFLSRYVGEELAARGLPIATATTDAGTPKAHLKTFRMQNQRASAFSPFVTFTFIGADLETSTGKKRIGVFVVRGKVPVWSFDELIEPTLNEPLSVAVKEFASKVANKLYGYRASDAKVKELIAKTAGARTPTTYLDVYELGFTNNPQAVETLAALVKDADESVRVAAISSLGNIGAVSKMALLHSIYDDASVQWHDRAMAIKAIADLDTVEGNAFVSGELKKLSAAGTDKNAVWTSQVLALYQ